MSEYPTDPIAAISMGGAGFKDVGEVSASGSLASRLLGATTGTAVLTTINIPMPRNDLLPIMRIQYTGLSAGVSNFWFPIMVSHVVIEGAIDIIAISKGTSSGRQINFLLNNHTGASSTFPGCGINIAGRLYEYPWSS